MVVISKGDFIWIESAQKSQFNAPIGARVIGNEAGRILVVDDIGNEQYLQPDSRIRVMHATSIQGVEDMIKLDDLHEAGMLRNFLIRYKEKLIYTFIGSILIAVNPYCSMPIYGPDTVRLYRNKRIGEQPPHIFAIADNAYTSMRTSRHDQCIIISGESGAGKTESTKVVLQFLATVSGQHSWIEQQVLEANPIMEVFGNAKTLRNDNSSRFGKYIEVHFDGLGAIEGARIEQYLLEKSRIVSQQLGERNYHVFYCLLAGLGREEKHQLELTTPGDYHYLAQGRCLIADGRNDVTDFLSMQAAMKVLTFKDAEIWSIYRLLAAILHTGNIKYFASMVNNLEVTEIQDTRNVARVAKLLQVDDTALLTALTTRSISMRDERVVSRLTAAQAVDARDGLVKQIYGRLFVHIVRRINDAILRPPKAGTTRSSIGILDIFGFENFEHNSFEQLCINLANEHLQQFFVRHVFRLEQVQYEAEGINWRRIEFTDNQAVLDLIGARQLSIMALVDEESIFPRGTDHSLLAKLHQNHAKNDSLYARPKSDLSRSFGLTHFAGVVFYNTRGFLEKNRDTFSTDLLAVVQTSQSRFLRRLFDEPDANDAYGRIRQTVGSQFRRSLEALMTQLGQCEPFFIRCIKPNEFKTAMNFDRDLVLRQLRYSGMLDTIRIRKAGYPIRHDYAMFVERYRILVPKLPLLKPSEFRSGTKRICRHVLGEHADYQLGHTRVFLKDYHDVLLEEEYERVVTRSAIIIQKTVMGWLQRRRFLAMRDAAVVVQARWRGYAARKRYIQILQGIARLQAVLRSRQAANHYKKLRSIVTQFQACCRGTLLRNELRSKRNRDERRQAMIARAADIEPPLTTVETINADVDIDNCFDFLHSDDTDHATTTSATFTSINSGSLPLSTADLPPPAAVDEDFAEYQFVKFAATYFQGQASAQHVRKLLRQPLLAHESPGDQLASLAVWAAILRFMTDLPEPNPVEELILDRTPVMARLFSGLGVKFTKEKATQALTCLADFEMGPLDGAGTQTGGTLRRSRDETGKRAGNTLLQSLGLLDSKPSSNFDKLHFIVGNGILRPGLRDEIFCQICKQLVNNPSKRSAARGWILLSLCVGCFAPSDRFIKFLYCFIREHGPRGAVQYSTFIEHRLRRTVQNGTRHQPPSFIELQACKARKPVSLPVTLMDGSIKTINADSATSARELCTLLAERIGLGESFGFSIYIALFDRVSSLGSGDDHVLDAVSQCEQYAREQGRSEKSAPWRLFFRKEIFTPWHDTAADLVSTELIYQQVARGVKYGEYRCDREEDLALLAAQQFFVDQEGGSLDVAKLEASLPKYLPDFELSKQGKSTLEHWLQAVLNLYRKKLQGALAPLTPIQVKQDVVVAAMHKWPLLFSRFYEAYKFSGPPLPKNEVIVAVNFTGIYVVDDKEQILAEFSFTEVSDVTCQSTRLVNTETFTIHTVVGGEYTFQSPNAEDVRDLVVFFLSGLRSRSKYAVVVKDIAADERSLYPECRRGDLLLLAEPGIPEPGGFARIENARTNARGSVPVETLYVLPTLKRPSVSTLDLFRRSPKDPELKERHNGLVVANPAADVPYTLEEFAADHFRQPSSLSTSSPSAIALWELWRYSRVPLTAPVLKKLEDKPEFAPDVVASYLAILKYMGDHPMKQQLTGVVLAAAIFGPALKHEALRDETFCHLMKQLTENYNPISLERGWELMWLATGLFPPSKMLYRELNRFLKSRDGPLPSECLARVQKTIKAGVRLTPPHQVELEAVRGKVTQIYHVVTFPNGASEAVEVDSTSKARDFGARIALRLGLRSSEGFSLFVKVGETVVSMPENDFFFDSINRMTDWLRQTGPEHYQVYFIRKLWLDVEPGTDVNADLVFHFWQELPKYLRGYHACSKKDVIHMAALLLRAETRDDRQPSWQAFGQTLERVVPRTATKQHSASEWRKLVNAEYAKLGVKTANEAKLAFLRCVAVFPTFGSAFFEVKQSSDPTMPSRVLVAINKTGVNLLNPDSKDLIVNYPFTAINNWTTGNTYFHITIGNLMRSNRLLLETNAGNRMDDLLSSYIHALLNAVHRPSEDDSI